ncbi:MAG: tetratricopeptide repeat protein [Chitinophagaceae bacterium]|nr:tetratricopeptide repeat protein [Chitinophagaceae bacterium]
MKKRIMLLLGIAFIGIQTFSQLNTNGFKLMEYQRYQSAIDVFSANYQNNPQDSINAYWLGQAFIKNKNIDSAIVLYQKLSSNNNSYIYKLGLAQALALKSNKTKATNLINGLGIFLDQIQSAHVAVATANAYTGLGLVKVAEKYYLKAISLDNTDMKNYIILCNNYLKIGDGNNAFKLIEKALKADSNYAATYYTKAKIFISQNNKSLFLPLLQKTLEKDSMFTPAWYEMYRYAYYNDKAMVKKYYAKYLELSDKNEKVDFQLLVLDYNAKKYKSVIDRANKMMKDGESETPVDVYKYVAYCYNNLNNIPKAYEYMSQYMQIQEASKITYYDIYLTAQYAARQKVKDSTTLAHINWGYETDTVVSHRKYYAGTLLNHYLLSNDKMTAVEWREKLMKLKGTNAVDLYKIGVAYFELDQLDVADSIFNDFVNLYPKQYKGIYMQAGIKSQKDSTIEIGTAVPYFEDFVSKAKNMTQDEDYKPMLEQSYNYLGSYYLIKKDYKTALNYYTQLQKFKPDSKELKQTIVGIKKYLRDVEAYRQKKKSSNS